MKIRWFAHSTLAFVLLFAGQARATATVAVMPVQGVNLSEGQADAIGVMFANAFAREANIAVATPLETKLVLAETKNTLAAAARLGVLEYIEVTAIQLGSKTTLSGIRYTKDGKEVFRSEAAANGLEDMNGATVQLARALAWGASPQQVAGDVTAPPIAPPMPAEPTGPKHYPAAIGLRSGIIFPLASGKTISSMMSLQFLARIGPRGSFAEVGAGFAVPSTTASGSNTIEMGGLYAELGGGGYLSDGGIAPYLGGGVSPRIWFVDSSEGGDASGATCTVYGMAGVTFTRDYRARVFGELRVSQFVIALSKENYGSGDRSTYYPTELSLQIGIGW